MFHSFHPRAGFDNHFHVMRHLVAIAVVWTHSFDTHAEQPFMATFGRTVGNYAVDIFFIISGFVVMQSLARHRDPLKFSVARFLRIFPALVVVVLLTVLVLGPLVSELPVGQYFSNPDTWKHFAGGTSTLSVNVLLPGVFVGLPEGGVVNVPLWTLKYELAAYFLLLAGVLVAWRSRTAVLVLGLATVAALYVVARTSTPWPDTAGAFSNLVHLLLIFAIGAAGYVFKDRVRLHVMGIVALAALTWLTTDLWVAELVQSFLIAYAVFWLAFYPTRKRGQFQHLGDVSFGIYILAFPIQQTIRVFDPGIEPTALFLTAMVFTVPLAALSWLLVEKPAMARCDRLVTVIRSSLPRGLQRQLLPDPA